MNLLLKAIVLQCFQLLSLEIVKVTHRIDCIASYNAMMQMYQL